jgi:hypothetical protein
MADTDFNENALCDTILTLKGVTEMREANERRHAESGNATVSPYTIPDSGGGIKNMQTRRVVFRLYTGDNLRPLTEIITQKKPASGIRARSCSWNLSISLCGKTAQDVSDQSTVSRLTFQLQPFASRGLPAIVGSAEISRCTELTLVVSFASRTSWRFRSALMKLIPRHRTWLLTST